MQCELLQLNIFVKSEAIIDMNSMILSFCYRQIHKIYSCAIKAYSLFLLLLSNVFNIGKEVLCQNS